MSKVAGYPIIALFVEGTFLPSREGATRRFVGLARNLATMGFKVIVIHCYRGWSDLGLIAAERFTTYAVSPDVYYTDMPRLKEIITAEHVSVVQFFEIETIHAIGVPLKRLIPDLKLIYECHDVHSDFYSSLGASSERVETLVALERSVIPFCDFILCFTAEDLKALEQRGAKRDRMTLVPFGVEVDPISHAGSLADNGNIVFLGNLYHKPNQIAVRFIVNWLVPSLRALGTSFTFTIIGDCPSAVHCELQHDSVNFTGMVDRLADLLATMTLAIAPITVGSGIKVKMLDYFVAGLPAIGTELAFRGFPHNAGLVVNDLSQIQQAVAGLLKDKARRRRIGMRARRVAEQNDWKTIRQPLSRIYQEVVSRTSPSIDYPMSKQTWDSQGRRPYVLEDNFAQARFSDSPYPKLAEHTILQLGGRHPIA